MNQEERILKKMELNSYMLCELKDQGAPTWVRPAMLWDDRWLESGCSIERAKREAREKIIIFVPLCAEHISDDELRRAI